ncbi:MAG: biotin/lipoyl-binding protein, partial [Gammaproteobacteria bacterium]|nr:biotin/lipoyl-binding protein [Gammaproteobacteria bacterium]
MNKNVNLTTSLLMLLLLLFSSLALSGGAHNQHVDEHATEEAQGPQGGKLLTAADFALEVTIFEAGVPPEMRLYGYVDGEALAPADIKAEVTLQRLDGQQDAIRFSPEQQYLVGDISIAEPHSYSVDIDVSYQGQQYHWHYDSFEGRVELNDRIFAQSGIATDIAQAQVLSQKTPLYGVIGANPTASFNVRAPYPGTLTEILVQQGDSVAKGQLLARISNTATLKHYDIISPANGIISARFFNQQELIRDEVLF